jgi:hypothetical protein
MRGGTSHGPEFADAKVHDTVVGKVISICLIVSVCMVVMLTVLRRLTSLFEPSIGEIAVFTPKRIGSDVPRQAVQVAVANEQGQPTGAHCILASEVMTSPGGSLIIEVRRGEPHGAYVVHWAGGMTSHGASDCGDDVTVVVAKQDLMVLVNTAAGGFGLGLGSK